MSDLNEYEYGYEYDVNAKYAGVIQRDQAQDIVRSQFQTLFPSFSNNRLFCSVNGAENIALDAYFDINKYY